MREHVEQLFRNTVNQYFDEHEQLNVPSDSFFNLLQNDLIDKNICTLAAIEEEINYALTDIPISYSVWK